SVPIVIWGSTLILRWIERYPALVYLGAGILAATGVRMMLHEPLVTERFEPGLAVRVLLYLALTGAVLGAGFRRNHLHLQARIWRRHAELSSGVMQAVSSPPASPGQGAAPPVKKILVPVDGSANSEAALRHVIDRFLKDGRLEVHLLNVQAPLSRHISRLVPRRDLKGYQRDRAEQALLPGRNLLQRHSVPHSAHISTGDRAQSIVAEAKRLHCEQIVIGTARHKSLTRMLEDSVTAKILELTQVPVEIVTTGEISPLERYALAGGLAALAVMLLLAIIY
ncbi:MAG: universal stress protein, partial [Quisquiliibacterium sp.]